MFFDISDTEKKASTILILFLAFIIISCTAGDGESVSNERIIESNQPEQITAANTNAPQQAYKSTINKKYNFNVYIENSGSMDGYVTGRTEFENCVYNLVSDIKHRSFSDSLNLYYINSKPITWKKNADINQLSEFIERLEPSTFRQRSNGRGTSDLHKILSMVIDRVDNNNVGVVVSDFIFSPGRGIDAVDYLVSQQTNIKSTFATKLSKLNMSTLTLQCNSNFAGNYYDKENNATDFSNAPIKRPYYIMFIGPDKAIKDFIDNTDFERLKERGYKQMYYQFMHGINPAKYTPTKVMRDRLGIYDIDMPATKGRINKAEMGNSNPKFQFTVAVDFSGIVADQNYFLKSANYEIPPNYSIKIEAIKDSTRIETSGYTHLLKLGTNELRTQSVFVRLKDNKPEWINLSNSDNDANIRSKDQQQKTFGIKYLLQGIEDAYKMDKGNNLYLFSTEIKVTKR